MLRGYRSIVVAIGLVLLGAGPPQGDGGQKPQAASEKVEPALRDIATALNKANESSPLEQPCEEGEDQRSSDLCAQWKAAEGADSAANATWLFGAVGSAIGFLTLAAAAAAAWFAKKAADHTETGAKAAADAVAETKRIGEAQVRCYIAAESARIVQLASGLIAVYCTIKNYGSSPALNVRFTGVMTVFDAGAKEGAFFEMIHLQGGYLTYLAPPRQVIEMGPIQIKLVDESTRPFLDKPNALVTLRIEVMTEDVFGCKESVKARFDAMPEQGLRAARIFDMKRASDVRLT